MPKRLLYVYSPRFIDVRMVKNIQKLTNGAIAIGVSCFKIKTRQWCWFHRQLLTLVRCLTNNISE